MDKHVITRTCRQRKRQRATVGENQAVEPLADNHGGFGNHSCRSGQDSLAVEALSGHEVGCFEHIRSSRTRRCKVMRRLSFWAHSLL